MSSNERYAISSNHANAQMMRHERHLQQGSEWTGCKSNIDSKTNTGKKGTHKSITLKIMLVIYILSCTNKPGVVLHMKHNAKYYFT